MAQHHVQAEYDSQTPWDFDLFPHESGLDDAQPKNIAKENMPVSVMNHDTKAKRVYRKLRDIIVTTQLLPGAAINESDVMRQLSVGRTPLRDALHQLNYDGLVDIVPNRGTFVAQITLQDTRQIFEVLSGLEDIVSRLAVERCTAVDLEELDRLQALMEAEPEGITTIPTLNRQLHAVLLNIANNRLLEALFWQVFDSSLRVHYLSKPILESRDEQRLRVRKVRDALEMHDPIALAETLKNLILASNDQVSSVLFSYSDTLPD